MQSDPDLPRKNVWRLRIHQTASKVPVRPDVKVVMVPDLTQPDEEIKDMLYACVPTLMDLKQFILVGEDISGEQQICLSGSAISD